MESFDPTPTERADQIEAALIGLAAIIEGVQGMTIIYARWIRAGLMHIDDVPERSRAEVEALLEE